MTRLTIDDVTTDADGVRLRLGTAPVLLPGPLADLVTALLRERRGHAAPCGEQASPWLFPGGRPGRPISPSRLNQRLRAIGLSPGNDRSTALLELAAELPAALLAQMLGIHIAAAVSWQRAAAGDWTRYAADYASRGARKPTP